MIDSPNLYRSYGTEGPFYPKPYIRKWRKWWYVFTVSVWVPYPTWEEAVKAACLYCRNCNWNRKPGGFCAKCYR